MTVLIASSSATAIADEHHARRIVVEQHADRAPAPAWRRGRDRNRRSRRRVPTRRAASRCARSCRATDRSRRARTRSTASSGIDQSAESGHECEQQHQRGSRRRDPSRRRDRDAWRVRRQKSADENAGCGAEKIRGQRRRGDDERDIVGRVQAGTDKGLDADPGDRHHAEVGEAEQDRASGGTVRCCWRACAWARSRRARGWSARFAASRAAPSRPVPARRASAAQVRQPKALARPKLATGASA